MTESVPAAPVAPAKTRRAFVVGGALLSAALLWQALKGVDARAFARSFAGARYELILVGFLLLAASYLFRSLLWRNVLASSAHIRLSEALKSVVVGNMGNSILPARLGDVLRIHVVRHYAAVGWTFALGALIVERVIDVALLAILTVGAAFALPASFGLREALAGHRAGRLLAIIAGGVLLLALLARALGRGARLEAVLGTRRLAPLLEKWRLFRAGAGQRFGGGSLLGLFLFDVLAWASVIAYTHVMLRAFVGDVPFSAALLITVTLTFTFILPAAPGNIGIYQFVCVTVLALFGVERSAALGFSFALQLMDCLPTAAIGLVLMARLKIKVAQVRLVASKESA